MRTLSRAQYVADFFVQGDQQDAVGRVVDFAELKTRFKGWLDEFWDHSFLIHVDDLNAKQALEMVKPSVTLSCRITRRPRIWPSICSKKSAQDLGRNRWTGCAGSHLGNDESYAEASLDAV